MVKAIAWVKQNKELILTIFKVALVVVAAGMALIGLGYAITTLGSILIKSSTLGGDNGTSSSRSQADLYLNPPTEGVDFLDFSRIFELAELGYRYTRERLPAWIEQNPQAVQRDELLEFRSQS